jgi:hypothetical protein
MQKFSQQQTIIPPTPDEDLQLLINQYCLVRESSPLYTQSKPYHQYCLWESSKPSKIVVCISLQ